MNSYKAVMLVFLSLLTLFFSTLMALDHLPAEGTDVSFRIQDTLAYYHQFTDDQHWYGTNSWAVRFDFRNYFLGVPAEFTADNIWIYFPNTITQGNLSCSFYYENVNQPDLENSLLNVNLEAADVVNGWNVFPFEQTIFDSILWVVINYETNDSDQFLSASAGGGEHSYYESEGYYYSMSANNFNSEFLVCLEGEFSLDVIDIALLDLQISPEPAFLQEVYPILQLQNFHTSLVDSIYVLYNIYSPFETITDTIALPGTNSSLEAGEQLVLDLSGDSTYAYTILDTAAQYRFSASLMNNEDSFGYNNSLSQEYELFEIEQEKAMLECFLSLTDTATEEIWSDLNSLEQNIQVINYFPVLSDLPYYSNSAVERFNNYGLYGLPATVTAGVNNLIGYNNSVYVTQIEQGLEEFFTESGTYISADSLYAQLNDVTEIADLNIFIRNDSSFVFSSYLSDLTLYVALIEDSVSYNSSITGSVMHDIILEKSDLTLGFGEVDSSSVSIDIGSLEPIANPDKIKLIYWIQNNGTFEIDHLNSTAYLQEIEYDQITEGGSNDIPDIRQVKVYPNPFTGGNELKLEISANRNITELKVKIFNIKGQLVRTLEPGPVLDRSSNLTWDGRDDRGEKVASGLYLIDVSSGENQPGSTVKKCMLIR